MPDCPVTSPHPAVPRGATLGDAIVRNSAAADSRWSLRPYTILVPTGIACDAIEAPAPLAVRLIAALSRRRMLGPVAVTGRRWVIFTEPGGECDQLRLGGFRVLVHGLGSWVAVPPSPLSAGPMSWEWAPPVKPPWRLPSRGEVLELVDAAFTGKK